MKKLFLLFIAFAFNNMVQTADISGIGPVLSNISSMFQMIEKNISDQNPVAPKKDNLVDQVLYSAKLNKLKSLIKESCPPGRDSDEYASKMVQDYILEYFNNPDIFNKIMIALLACYPDVYDFINNAIEKIHDKEQIIKHVCYGFNTFVTKHTQVILFNMASLYRLAKAVSSLEHLKNLTREYTECQDEKRKQELSQQCFEFVKYMLPDIIKI